MSEKVFKYSLILTAVLFVVIFGIVVVPAFFSNPDIVNFFISGFVNPYASGYSTDVILCWVVLCIWVVYEASNRSVKYGWVCLALGVVPGVAVGFALYLVIRHGQVNDTTTAT